MSVIDVKAHLLPPGSTVGEKAAASLGVLVSRLDDPIASMADPAIVPATALPHQAWGFSIDVYDPAWSEQRKRQVIGEWVSYHERKTTVAGVRMALGYRDATLTAYNLPRHGFFCGGRVSAEDEARWRDSLPEIRIYHPRVIVRGGPVHRFAGVNMVARGDARMSRRAVLVKNRIETPLSIVPSGSLEKITMPIGRKPVMIAGRGGWRIAAPRNLGARVLAIKPATAGDDYVRPVATSGDRGTFIASSRKQIEGDRAVFTPAGQGGHRFAAPIAIANAYISLRYSDEPGRAVSKKPGNIVGRSRIMRKPYSANWTVDWSRTMPRSRFAPGRKVAASSAQKVHGLMEAIQSASALRDINSITLKASTRLTYADLRAVNAGTMFGQRKRILPNV